MLCQEVPCQKNLIWYDHQEIFFNNLTIMQYFFHKKMKNLYGSPRHLRNMHQVLITAACFQKREKI